LQDLKTLPIEFNFLADYNHETLDYQDKEIKPCFLHIYHHWGNKEWDVWRDVSAHILD
jgi:lipopolysaccharide biosynthesis glycosyltransferase